MKIHNCDLCGASDRLPLPGDPSGKIGICTGCGFVYVAERRDVKDVARAWDEIYEKGLYDPAWPGVQARLFYVAAWLDVRIGLEGKNLLDIGSGDASFLRFCRDRGAYSVGLDPSISNVNRAKQFDIACFHGWAGDDQPDIGQYDIVTLNWTLENTGDCMSVLRWAKRQLAPKGHLVVATGSRIGVPFKKPLSSYLPQDPGYPHDTHCFRWSRSSVSRAVQKVGLSEAATYDSANDWDQNDVMIVSFPHQRAPGPFQFWDGGFHDHAHEVAEYFRRWQREFP